MSGFCGGSGSAGGVGGEGEDKADDDAGDGTPDCEDSSDRDGVFSSASRSRSTSIASFGHGGGGGGALWRLADANARGAASWDSSNVRLGLRPLWASEDASGGVRGARLDGAVLDVA